MCGRHGTSCTEERPADCIYEGGRKLYIHPNECIDCGACEPACPVQAISHDRHVDPDQTKHLKDDGLFFTEILPGRSEPLGSPGGAHNVKKVGVDTEPVNGR